MDKALFYEKHVQTVDFILQYNLKGTLENQNEKRFYCNK